MIVHMRKLHGLVKNCKDLRISFAIVSSITMSLRLNPKQLGQERVEKTILNSVSTTMNLNC